MRVRIKFFVYFFILNNWVALHAQSFNVYFGDLHSHSVFSWDAQPGALPPAEAYAYAKHVAKIDFLAISDHTNGLAESDYQTVRAASQLYDDPDSQFVAIAGQELGSLGSRGYGHLNIFEPLTRADNLLDNDTRFNLMRAYDFLIQNELLGQFNHPTTENGNRNFNNLQYEVAVDPWMANLEVLNGKRSATFEKWYLFALKQGWHVGAVGDQDNHARNYGNTVSFSGDIYLTGVLADSLTKPKILDALKSHRTYAFQTSPSTDRIFLTEFTADGHWMGETFSQSDNVVSFSITATAETPFFSAHLYKNGFLIDSVELNSTQFHWEPVDTVSSGSVYYFIKIMQQDSDILWSSPVWVESPGEFVPPDEILPISELRANRANGLPEQYGRANVKIRGIVTVDNEFGDLGPRFVQDETGAISVFGELPVRVARGFDVTITGSVDFFNGLTQITPFEVERNAFGVPLPAPILVNTQDILNNGEQFEGQLVRIENVTIVGNFPPSGANRTLTIRDSFGSCSLFIDGDTDIAGSTTPQGPVHIVGVASQFDPAPPYLSGYEIRPRDITDIDVITSVEDESDNKQQIPSTFALRQNYPNPFNAETVISYSVPVQSQISLSIYNITGQKIRSLVDEISTPGEFQVTWDGKNDEGKQVASGIFVYKLDAPGISFVKKLILLR
ncbi:MAG: FlgD immunoglobulin-like domain containing protein [bacterium]